MINKISVPIPSCSDIQEKPKLKRKSNDEQYRHNAKVMAKLEDVSTSLSSQDIDRARVSVIEAKDLIKRRQKLIQLADGSELGWRLVAEYESNPIASGSEDEKRIYKAEARANRKAKADKVKKARIRNLPYRRRVNTGEQTTSQPQRSMGSTGQTQRTGACYNCGDFGHWKADCQQNRRPNNKLSVSNCHIFVMKSRKTV
ncbi:uncharacterized protein LOC132744604 [Ruditapes philippinarum]|uniref:uncharacterized protein LOC132744604 n=1 Tax=Ruditapes philippinarum TaxID=129788 RepID=UPI00295BA8AE|nr:uncharacterized protein LOC132744604 [Ruditapes philippinarum]